MKDLTCYMDMPPAANHGKYGSPVFRLLPTTCSAYNLPHPPSGSSFLSDDHIYNWLLYFPSAIRNFDWLCVLNPIASTAVNLVVPGFFCCDNDHNQEQLGAGRVYFGGYFQVAVLHQRKSGVRTGAWDQELKQRPWRNAVFKFAPPGLLSLLSCTTQATCPGRHCANQLLIKKMLWRIAHKPLWWGIFSSWGSYSQMIIAFGKLIKKKKKTDQHASLVTSIPYKALTPHQGKSHEHYVLPGRLCMI